MASPITVHALLFASYADALGRQTVPVTLPAPATVGALVERLRALPGASVLPPRPLVAVNAEYAAPDRALADGDEVALIPPVAGG